MAVSHNKQAIMSGCWDDLNTISCYNSHKHFLASQV
jgi:hypothetical protein